MFIIGLLIVALVSVGSLAFLIGFSIPEEGSTIMILFFSTLFFIVVTMVTLLDIVIRYLAHVEQNFAASFRRGILLGLVTSGLLALHTRELFDYSIAAILVAPVGFIEWYFIIKVSERNEN